MSPITLVEALASVPDPRSPHGRRYPFVPVLCLVTLGLLMGKRTLGSIAKLRDCPIRGGHAYNEV
jgi:hypothetical protein